MIATLQRGAIVQFKSDWGTEPTPGNTSIVRRVAKDSSWADVKTPYGSKRVPNPEKYLKIITEPLVVSITDWYLPLVFSILGLDINYFLGKVEETKAFCEICKRLKGVFEGEWEHDRCNKCVLNKFASAKAGGKSNV